MDSISYLLLPNNIANKFDGYRADFSKDASLSNRYPRNYFISHPTRGFDIKPDARAWHSFDGASYPIWSNSFGCFDREWSNVPSRYYYFAGDSTTWGYTPFEQKFATLFEERTGIPSLKCGVTHTGQLHQFEKFREIIRKIGFSPKNVIVGYSSNDVANDYAHPHTTVVDGWQVDNAFVDAEDYGIVRVDRAWIEEKMSEALAHAIADHNSFLTKVKDALKRYSISAQVARGAWRAIRGPSAFGLIQDDAYSYRGHPLKHFYAVERKHIENGKFRYGKSQFTAANRKVLLEWQKHAKEEGYRLTLVLVAFREYHGSSDFFAELKDFLQTHGINYIDLFEEFQAAGVSANQVYWQHDGHMSPGGNRLVADILVKRLADHNTSD